MMISIYPENIVTLSEKKCCTGMYESLHNMPVDQYAACNWAVRLQCVIGCLVYLAGIKLDHTICT